MKKIGILSMQKVANYGSFLQGFALKKIIENEGNVCEFLDIEPGIIFPELQRTPLLLLKKTWERYAKIDFIKRLYYTLKFRSRFRKEFNILLGVNIHTIRYFDLVVIGSDEVFNFAQTVSWGFTTQLYGEVDNANKVISYAGSFGHTTISDIEKYNVGEKIKFALNSMAAISVRDSNSFQIVKMLTGKSPLINIDPVLLFDFDGYIRNVERANYILIYSYPNRINSEIEITAIKKVARKYNKKLISIGFYFSWCDEVVIPNPFEVLGYFKNADFVITDTFHGAVMSLKFNKNFAAIVRKSNVQKMTSLLSQFQLENRIVDDMSLLEEKLLLKSDYNYVNEKIENERKVSLEYLKQYI